jgi:hypothetical protein
VIADNRRREDPRILHSPAPRLPATAEAGRAGSRPRRRRAATPAPDALALVALLAVVVLAGCEPFVQGNGVLHEETRDVATFEGVSTDDGIKVEITAGAAQQVVKVSGDENVLQHIETTVRNDAARGFAVLDVKSSVQFDSTNPVMAVISVPTVRYVAATHACTVTAKQVATPAFEVDASENAYVTLSGAGGASLSVQLQGGQRGGAHLDARGYPVDTASVTLAGGSTASLAARVSVSGSADGGSSVENTGAATCNVAATGGSAVSCKP